MSSYSIESYRRESTPAYGGDDKDRRRESVETARVAADAKSVELELGEMRSGFVYELRLKNLTKSGRDDFFPAAAFYTVCRLP